MINIINKSDCVGCNACVQRCPKQCISMKEDEQGFIYPKVDLSICINCGLCEKVCPVINQSTSRNPLITYAAKNIDDNERQTSSSGGIFLSLAEKVIEDGGVVFGARFNEKWEVVHDYAEIIEDVKVFKGSKYVQSQIGNTFRLAEKFLNSGRKVLFSGTPCQIAALGLFLRKDYSDKLLKVDFVCHGVPSPKVWKEYLKFTTRPKGASDGKNTVFTSLKDEPVITGISFRDKRLGWEKYGFHIRIAASLTSGKNSVFTSFKAKEKDIELLYEPLNKNIFMQGFLNDLYLRPACFSCPTKHLKSESDITLADFWGIKAIDKSIYDKKGVSMVIINTENGKKIFSDLDIIYKKSDFKNCVINNPAILHSAKKSSHYDNFFKLFNSEGFAATIPLISHLSPNIIKKFSSLLKKIHYKLFMH